MNNSEPHAPRARGLGTHFRLPLIMLIGCLAIALILFILPRGEPGPTGPPAATNASGSGQPGEPGPGAPVSLRHRGSSSAPAPTAAEIVAGKVKQFGRHRREIVQAMADRAKVTVAADVERFFAALKGGNWEEIDAAFQSLNARRRAEPPSPDLDALWPPILESLGVAQEAHAWPAQRLLDYGSAVLGSLRPGMVYVGGTDPGRFIPTLLNETDDGERRIIVTQNALADRGYLDYLGFLYGDRAATLTHEDSERAFQDYLADAQKRLAHDQQFPSEPKQIQPGEEVATKEGRVQVSGQIAVMGLNERLLQMLMQKNPELSFALEESFPLKSTYAAAVPLGPIMELRAEGGPAALTAERAAQSVEYWQAATRELLADPESADSSWVRATYGKMAAGQAGLLLDHNYPGEAEQTFRLANEISPTSPEAVFRYVNLLMTQGRMADSLLVAENASKAAPDNQQFHDLAGKLRQFRAAQK